MAFRVICPDITDLGGVKTSSVLPVVLPGYSLSTAAINLSMAVLMASARACRPFTQASYTTGSSKRNLRKMPLS